MVPIWPFSRFFGQGWSQPAQSSDTAAPAWWPAIETYTDEGTLHIRCALPGVDPKDVEVSVSDGLLTIKGVRKAQSEDRDANYLVREFAYGVFERTVSLPEGVDAGKVAAKYTNGMLEVTMPAPLAVAPKKVEIQVAGQAGERKAVKAA